MKLTDRIQIPDNQISNELKLHIVDPNNTSQNAAGSSYWATRSQLHKAIPITYAALLILYNAGTMGNTLYKITDRADAGVFVMANSNTLSLDGIGVFLNPDFQSVGVYSGISGFGANLGIWKSTLTPGLDDVVIWNGIHYKNETGAVGTAPNGDGVNWSALIKNVVNGYIQVSDIITYDIISDTILSRKDNRLNYVEADTTNFQWGNDNVKKCSFSGSSSVNILNNTGSIIAITAKSGGTLSAINNKGTIEYSTIEGISSLNCNSNAGFIAGIAISNGSSLVANMNAGIVLGYCNFSVTNNGLGTIILSPSVGFLGKSITNGYSDFNINIDMSNTSYFDANVLDLDASGIVSNKHIGIVTLINNGGQTINSILNIQGNHKVRFLVANSLTQNFSHTSIGAATSNQLISDVAAPLAITGRFNGSDFIEYEKNGTLIAEVNHKIYS